jgi:tetratricopeptide (TPR) repeat protein
MSTEPSGPPQIDELIARIADGRTIETPPSEVDAGARRVHALASLLDGVARAADLGASPQPVPSTRSSMLGPYRLLHLLGEGGMGEVWMAERCDGQVEQRVAIKRVRGASRLSTMRSLLRERRILARLNHPNIAHFLGADIDGEGEPYLVIEYVDGVALDRWCRERQPSLAERLRLFLAICAAVEHAHRHLVVHRDLKPANVLVTADDTPKLLDFGIARLLEDSASGQTTGLLALTPRYAAPEQFNGDDITPAVDQYALGLLLHEMLTGQLPMARSDGHVARIAAALESGDPPPASSTMPLQGRGPVTAAMVRGDLDAIIGRCLRRDPLSRYASVGDLAADLRRHLAGEPVLARSDVRGYRLRRFVARHRLPIALTGLAMLVVLGALVGALIQADRATREAAAAKAARDSAEAVNNFLTDMLAAPTDGRRGADVRVVDLLDAAEARLSRDQHLSEAQRLALHLLLARSFASLGRDDRAVAAAEAGLGLAGEGARHRVVRMALLQTLAQTEALRCRVAAADRAVAQLRREADAAHSKVFAADASVAAARIADCNDDYALQRSEAERALALTRDDPEAFHSYAGAAEQSARASFAFGDVAAAEATLQEALARWPADDTPAIGWISLRHLLLQVTAARGDLAGAERIARDNLAQLEPRHGDGPHPETLGTRSALASILFDRGDFAGSLAMNDVALAHATALYGADGEETLLILANRANALKALGRYDEAEAGYRRVIDTLLRAKETPGSNETRLIHTFNLLELLNERGRFAEAATLGEELLGESARVLGREHIVTLEARDALGVTALGRGDAEAAEVLHRSAFAAKQKVLGDDSPYTATARYRRALALARLGRSEEARAELEAAVDTRRKVLGAEHPDTQAAERALRELGG